MSAGSELKLPTTMAALVTPFDEHGRLDVSRWEPYVAWLEASGIDGLFCFGTTGEGLTMTPAEREEGLEALMRFAHRPVVAHVGAMAAADTRRLLEHAADVGAQAAAVVLPSYYPHDEAALIQYLARFAERSPIPLLVYNIPGFTHTDLTPEAAARLVAQAPRYVGIKDSTRQPNRLPLYRATGLRVWVGAESLVWLSTLLGEGSVTGMAAAFPDLVTAVVRHAHDPEAAVHHQRLVEVHGRLRGPTIPALRAALRRRGFNLGPPRLPFRDLTPEEARAVHAAVDSAL